MNMSHQGEIEVAAVSNSSSLQRYKYEDWDSSLKQGTERLMTASGLPDRGIKSLLFILNGFYLHPLLQAHREIKENKEKHKVCFIFSNRN